MDFQTFLITTAFMIALLAIHMYYTTKDLKETLKQEVNRRNEENRRQYDDMKTAFGKMSAQISDNTKENRRQYDDMKTSFGKMSALVDQISDNTKDLSKEHRGQYINMTAKLGKMSALMEHISRNTEASDTKPKDCTDIDKRYYSGIYTIYPIGVAPIQVYCDMKTDNGGWTVFQRRVNGEINFQRDWDEYEAGFGNLISEFWLGNRYLNVLTSRGRYELRIDLEDFEENRGFAKYSQFYVGDASTNYKLTVSSYSGNVGDSLTGHSGNAFSTKDRDNDRWTDNCAATYKGAWWYTDCHSSNLNGAYLHGEHSSFADGVNWYAWKGHKYSLKTSVMMLRRVL